MGNPKQKWTAEEEEALRAGIAKYGAGKWKFIQRDPEFNIHLNSRSNIDLKDKWRNMSAAIGQSREKSRIVKPRSTQDPVAAVPVPPCQNSVPPLPVVQDLPADLVKDDPSKDPKIGERYKALVFEALSTTKEPNGLDIISLMRYIQQRAEVPTVNFRKTLGSRLRRLVAQDKLEKVDNCYRIKDKSSSEPKPASVIDNQPKQVQNNYNGPRESMDTAAALACLSVAKAEDLSFLTKEAVMEEERIRKLVEEQEQIVELAKEILAKCIRDGPVAIA